MASTQALLFAAIFSCLLTSGNNTQTVRWYVPGNGQLEPVTTPINGSVTFSWTSSHDLWEIPSLSCPATFTNGGGITQLAAQSSGGSRTVQFPTAGTRYFSCSVSDHCEEASPAPAPGPRSRYGNSYGGGRSCGGNSTSGSGYGGSSGSGSNYAGAPGSSSYGGGSNSTYGGSPSREGSSSSYGGANSTYGGGNSTYGGGNSTYGGGGASYAGGSSSNYGDSG